MILLCYFLLMRLASVLLTLLLLVQVLRVSASGLDRYRSTSRSYQIRYTTNSNQKLLFINGRLVDQYLFCNALRLYCRKDSFVKGFAKRHNCGLDVPLDNLPSKAGRKLLQKDLREGSRGNDLTQGNQRIGDKSSNSPLTTKQLAIAVPAMFVLCCTLLCPCFHARRKENEHAILVKESSSMDSIPSVKMTSAEKIPGSPLRVPPLPLHVPPSPSRFSMSPKFDRVGSVHLNISQVARATNNFSPSQVIGEGGFGIVYKAQLPDGQVVAVKRAKKGQFDAIRTEFRSEVELLAKIDHRNLVKLLGYIDKGNERLIITEYVPNGTLREHLDGKRRKILDFKQRLEISIDVAHGLTYLHLYSEKQIIHRDVKSSNVLLTESMRAKVADFGFARLGDTDSDKTHVSTKVKGTVGYLDPEYMRTFQLTPKSDVYSFGVLLLETLTGRRPVEVKRPPDERVTLRWAFRKYAEGNILEIVDPRMEEAVDKGILMKMFALAIQCAAPIRADRSDMKSVGEQLWGIRMEYLRSGT